MHITYLLALFVGQVIKRILQISEIAERVEQVFSRALDFFRGAFISLPLFSVVSYH